MWLKPTRDESPRQLAPRDVPVRGDRTRGLNWLLSTNPGNCKAGLRHVRVAVGRDYAGVPPTRGIFKSGAASTLEVSVEVTPGDSAATAADVDRGGDADQGRGRGSDERVGRPRVGAGRFQFTDLDGFKLGMSTPLVG